MPTVPTPSRRRKILISAFVVFHFACVFTLTWPGLWPLKRALLWFSLPLPEKSYDPAAGDVRWTWASQPVARTYLEATAQWQSWLLFAPNPLIYNRYLTAEVIRRDGGAELYEFPRVDRMGLVRAHLESRFREYQFYAAQKEVLLRDLARYVARRRANPANPPVRVVIYAHEMDLPAPSRAREPYGRLIRDGSRYARRPVLAYTVTPEDLR